MLIFIPMAGFGDRYRRAGYTEPKPLIPVDGETMISRVLSSFTSERSSDDRVLFCVNRLHAETTPLLEVLGKLSPTATTRVIETHKDGPIATLLACEPHIADDEPVLVNYCDFGVDWSFDHFRSWVESNEWDGAMTAYRGFHPHSLGPTLYAYMRTEGERVVEIREKHHFTPNKFDEFASSGLYYFRRGRDLKRACHDLIRRGERVNNEFYVSMAVQLLVEEGAKVGVYPLRHFYQWGTPEDLRDYEGWATSMRKLDDFVRDACAWQTNDLHVVPMAGRGQRFSSAGYQDPKPLIDVAGAPMIERALQCLPSPVQRVLVAQNEHAEDARFKETIGRLTGDTCIVSLDHITNGQACTAELGVRGVDRERGVLFAPCDAGYVYDLERFVATTERGDADLVVFAARNHLPAVWRPHMYGWIHVGERSAVKRIAVKQLVEGIAAQEQQVITGTFWFRSVGTYLAEYEAMLAANDRVNGEFYIDTMARRMVESGKKVLAFTVDKYIPWGTPEELETFKYWNDVFRGGRRIDRG